MEQHPIPQQISSYEFKLIGEMTLKQFLKAAGGILLAILINSTKLIVLVKWPLMLLVGGGGLLLAFVPFEDRPLEKWCLSFLKAIYSPTIYLYKRGKVNNRVGLDLTNKKTTEEIISNDNQVVSNLKGSRLKDAISVAGIKLKKKKTKIEVPVSKVEKKQVVAPTTTKKVETIQRKPVQETAVENKEWKDQKTNLDLKTEKLEATGKVVFGNIPMPDIPKIPNVVVGMATDIGGKIVDGVIVDIQDMQGNSSRVLKTNSLGQFKTSTPLSNGKYLIIAEKEGYNFDRVNIDLSGQIIKPIRIISN